MQKFIKVLIIPLCLLVIMTGCGKKSNENTKTIDLGNSATSLLDDIVKKTSELDKDDEYGLATIKVTDHQITKEDTEDVLGLKEDDFTKYIEEAVESKVTDSWMTHSIVVAKLKSGLNTSEVANKIVKNTAPDRFGCLKVSKIEGAYYGNYVVFAASEKEIVDNVIKVFKEMTENQAQVITRENNWNTNMFDEE